jgi:hypothetical protein
MSCLMSQVLLLWMSVCQILLMNDPVKNQEKEATQARKRNLSAWNMQHSGRHDLS